MRRVLRRLAVGTGNLALATLLALPAFAQPRPGDVELVRALRAGGHVIVLRHAAADKATGDTDPLNFTNIRRQRQLTEQGRAAARAFGGWLRAIGVPIGEVVTSRFQRAYQTASLAGLAPIKTTPDVTEGGLVVSPNENARRAAALRQLVSAPLSAGQNRLIVTHKQNIMDAFGKEWFEVKEGEATIFKIEGTTYTLIARLQLDDWSRVAIAARQ